MVVPAYRSEATIRRCVEAIVASSAADPCEIVVVDDGGHRDLRAALAGLPARIVPSGGAGSAGAARNAGAAGFEGRFLVFVDADVLVSPDCLPALLQPLRDGEAAATVGNYSRDVAGLSFAARYKQLYVSRTYERRSRGAHREFWTAIGAIRAPLYRRLRGFDDRFRGAVGEDLELGLRIAARGERIVSVPAAVGRHERALTLAGLVRNDWRKGLTSLQHVGARGTRLTDSRHAGWRDIAAVALAVALPLAPALPLLPALCTPALYLAARADLLRTFASQGAWFALRALPLMWTLDLLRCACVARGLPARLSQRLRGASGAAGGPAPGSAASRFQPDATGRDPCLDLTP